MAQKHRCTRPLRRPEKIAEQKIRTTKDYRSRKRRSGPSEWESRRKRHTQKTARVKLNSWDRFFKTANLVLQSLRFLVLIINAVFK